MAWSHLQSASSTVTSGNGTVTYGSNVSSGSKLICCISVSASQVSEPVTSVKDGSGNAMTQLASTDNTATSGWTELWAMDTPSGDVGTKPVLTATVATNFGVTMLAQEVSGLLAGNTSAMLDGAAVFASSITSTAQAAGVLSTAVNEYVLAFYGDPGNGVTVTNSTGWTADAANVNASSSATLFADYKNSVGSSESAVWALSLSGAGPWGTVIAAFQLAGGGATAAPVAALMGQPPVQSWGYAGAAGAQHSI
jgi:hypothetical protein